MDLFIIRHGETAANKAGIVQGPRIDDVLTETGMRQAQRVAAAFSQTRVDVVLTSPLKRARMTAEEIAKNCLGQPAIEVVPESYELDWGDFTGKPFPDVHDELQAVLGAWVDGRVDYPMPGGESPLIVSLRLQSLLTHLQRMPDNATVVFVGHGRLNRILITLLLGQSLVDMVHYDQPNACINHLGRVGTTWVLNRMGDTSHLENDRTDSWFDKENNRL